MVQKVAVSLPEKEGLCCIYVVKYNGSNVITAAGCLCARQPSLPRLGGFTLSEPRSNHLYHIQIFQFQR